MNVTKYVRLNDGTIIVFSKYLGMQHSEMAAGFEAMPADVADAGFVDIYQDQFEVFGESQSLGAVADGRTNRLLTEAIAEGRMRIYEMRSGFYATTADRGDDYQVADIEKLRKSKIF